MKKNKHSGGRFHSQKPFENPEDYDNLYTVNSGSYTDCTGLMYKPPENKFEYESYADLYHFGPSDYDVDEYFSDKQ